MFNAAKYYDKIYRSKPYGEEIEAIFPYLNQGSVLEIGGGTGGHATHLKTKGFDVLVTDREPRMLEVAKTKGLTAAVLDIEKGGTLQKQFDNATMLFHVFNFLKDQESALRNISGFLRKGGRVIFDCWDSSIKKSGWAWRNDGIVTRITKKSWSGDTATVRFWFPIIFSYERHTLYCPSSATISDMLKRTGFNIVEHKNRGADELFVAEKI